MTNAEIAKIFKALCDERRIEILKLLTSGEKCACSLLEELQISQPTLSHHMRILCDAGIVIPRKEGKWTHYRIDTDGSKIAIRQLQKLTSEEALATCNEKCK